MVLIKNIGLAAYIKMNKCMLIDVVDGRFKFETHMSVVEWKLRYSNSICLKRDQALQDLLSYYNGESFEVSDYTFWSKSLGFCAFAVINKVKLVGFDDSTKRFFFESNVSQSELQVTYINSECSTHDNEVNRLRELKQ